MNQKQANDLATLYHFIKNDVKPKNFDLEHIVRGKPAELKEIECSSAGCVAGYMPVIWPRRFRYINGWTLANFDINKHSDNHKELDIACGNTVGYHDVFAEAFGVQWEEASDITDFDRYNVKPTKGVVLARIKKLADKYGYVL